jgi:dienelactone hydrolase
VAERTIRVALLDRTVLADTYRPGERAARAVVVVAHGFSRTRDTLVSLARELAGADFAVVVPDLPQLGDHEANARFLAALGEVIRKRRYARCRLRHTTNLFAGFSAGGLATLLAAARSRDVLGWIELDPVDRDGMAVRAASELLVPAFVVRAPPSPCNAESKFAAAIERLPRLLATAWRPTRRTAISSPRPIRAASDGATLRPRALHDQTPSPAG